VATKAKGLSVLGVEASGHLPKIEVLIANDDDPHAATKASSPGMRHALSRHNSDPRDFGLG